MPKDNNKYDDDDDDEEEFTFEDDKEMQVEKVTSKGNNNHDDDDDDDDFEDDAPISKLKKKKSKKTEQASEARKTSKKETKTADVIPSSSSAVASKKKKVNSNSNKKRKSSGTTGTGTSSDPKPDSVVSSSSSPIKKKVKTETSSTNNNRELKKLDKTERLQYAMQSFLWWDSPEPAPGCQWTTMEHAGVSFTELYAPHGIPMMYQNQPITSLTPIQEEAATLFASIDPEGMHLGNEKTAPIFIKNFMEDFVALFDKKKDPIIPKNYTDCNFDLIRQHITTQKMIQKAATDAERKQMKNERSDTLYRYGYAIVDNHIEKVGNYNMEPPGTFRGRGMHPKMGKLKSRVVPEQVSINVSECAPVPKCDAIPPGHAWGDVRHDPAGQWLATWKENINNQSKYMQLAAQSSFKGKSDRSKYNKAALLCKNIVKIRKSYKNDLKSKDDLTKQLATAVWVIDRLALRVGGEKDTDEEADTVGCCSLRVEHLHIDPNQEGGDNHEIELEFLGKDSMLYKQTIDFGAAMYTDNNGMGLQVYDNLKSFCKKKKPSDQVFKDLNPTILNNHLKQFMDGLSAKVFRTYNASKTLQDELMKHEVLSAWKSLSVTEMVTEYNSANREVAILCNHQRSVSKAQETQLETIGTKVETLKKQKKQLKGILKKLNASDKEGIPVRKSFETMQEEVDKALAKATKMKESAKTNEEKIAATEADEKAKLKRKNLANAKFEKAHLWEKVPSSDQVTKKIELWTKKIAKMEMDLKHKDDNKEVSLGTSKLNYMDPRISVAFCKRNEIPIEKIFSKTLRDKFNWAMAVTPQWEFNESIAEE